MPLPMLGWVIAGFLALALGVLLLLGLRDRSALRRLTRAIEVLGEGRSSRPLAPSMTGALVEPARRFDEVAVALERRIDGLEEDRQQLHAVLSGMAEAVIAVDRRNRLVFANPSAESLFGLDDQSAGRLLPEVIRSPRILEAVEDMLAGTGPFQGEITLSDMTAGAPPRGGLERVVSVHGTPLPGSPPPGAVLVLHEVTELRRLERMRRDFVANVSHELKTPLASIIACVETLQAGALHDHNVNEHFLAQIGQQSERLNQLILDLLSLAKIEAVREFGLTARTPLHVAPLIEERAKAHRERAVAQNLRFEVEIEEEFAEAQVRADEEALRQILDNLIDNAIKYTPSGGLVQVVGRIDPGQEVGERPASSRRRRPNRSLNGASALESRPHVSIEVTDTGIGIPHESLSRIFERFYRVDKARSRELGGTGLGLSIVKHLVQSLNGRIEVDSRLGAGTSFLVRLPLFRPSDSEAEPSETATSESAPGDGPDDPVPAFEPALAFVPGRVDDGEPDRDGASERDQGDEADRKNR